jgi:tetratricopeptide (TPR) repeat protein
VVPLNLSSLKKTAQKVCWMVPFDRNPRFVGRQSQLQDLAERVFAEDRPKRAAIIGLGGVGKTQVALELAYRVREKYPECSIFWIPSTGMESIEQAYMNIGQQLGMQDVEPAEVKTRVQAHLSQESACQWLLIFDNADDMDMWMSDSDTPSALKTYLPRSRQGYVVFTTRNRRLAVRLASSEVIMIPEMDEVTAIDVLKKSLIQVDLLNDYEATTALLHQLTFLPLAITQAAAYINENGLSLADYVSLLQKQEEDVIDLLSEDFEDEGRYCDIKNPVATTWLISFNQIQLLDHLAADFLSFMSCVNPRDIPRSLLPPALSEKRMTDALGLLNAYSFISIQPVNQFLSLHRLVHLATRNWLRKSDSLEQWVIKTGVQLNEVFPDDSHENRGLWREYLPHVQYILRSEEFQNQGKAREGLLQKVGRCLRSDGRYNEAGTLFEEVVESRRKRLTQDHEKILSGMADLASTYIYQGRWKEAEDLEVQVIEIEKRVLGPEHPNILSSIANLALTYLHQGRWKEAEELEKQVIEISKRVLGSEHPDTIKSMGNLASTYRNQGRWKEAEELGVQVIEIAKRVLGPEHPNTLALMGNLALSYQDQGRWKEAEELEVQVVKIRKRVLGPEHPDTLVSIVNLASTFRNQGRWKEAEVLQTQVMEIAKRLGGPEHPGSLTIMGNLASTYRSQGRWKEAEKLEVQVMKIRKKVLGPEHPDTLLSIANLASTFQNQGQWEEAEKLEVLVLEIRKRVLGLEHPGSLTIMANLASTYRSQGRWKKAEKLEVQVMEIRKRVLGPEHPATLVSIANLAATFRNQGHWEEAEKLEVPVLEIRKRVLGREHPDTLASMDNLAHTWKLLGRNVYAAVVMDQCVKLRMRVLGANHPHTLSSIATLDEWRGHN